MKVTYDEHNIIHVNGKPFLPLGIWLQPEDTIAMWKDLGINLFIAESHPQREGTLASYVKACEEHNVYMSLGYRWLRKEGRLEELNRHPLMFTLHHPDEPDKPAVVSEATIEAGRGLRINQQRPLALMVDGKANSSAIIDPLKGSSFKIITTQEVTVIKLAIKLQANPPMDVISDIEFLADGKSILRTPLKNENARQEFALEAPVKFKELSVQIHDVAEGEKRYGAVAEIEALDAEGKNVLLSVPRVEARISQEQIIAEYQAIKKMDPQRLVTLTFMARFMDEVKFQSITKEEYAAFVPGSDIITFDLYPVAVYGKNLHWNAEGLKQLRTLVGEKKPIGIWLQASDAMNERDPGLTPVQIRANTWMSLIHGATFIAYFPQSFKGGFKFHSINEQRRAALKAVNKEVTELADIILMPPKYDLFEVRHEGGRVDAMQRVTKSGDKALLVLVNVVEEGEGKPITVSVKPQAFKTSSTPGLYGSKEPLPLKDGAWQVELQPWQTAVIVAEAAQ